tara:strand:+ start:567 stop:1184 length:618 start_codon:yes stop_codon:yes gene_type:complete
MMSQDNLRKNIKHKKVMEKQKEKVEKGIANADKERGVSILLTGNGKGKTSSAFGMAIRALGYDQKIGIVQFIKGEQLSGEELYIRNNCPDVFFFQMATGFTWDTQDREADIVAAKKTWKEAKKLLSDESFELVILDELTYMLSYDYLPEDEIIKTIKNRPQEQSVVITGRGGGAAIKSIMDTISEVKEVRHAFYSGIKARRGVDY